MHQERLTLRQAWARSPGPENGRQAAILAIKGFCMGAADIIPGVSGGTIAFITGIYDQLVDAIHSFDTAFLRRLLRFNLPGVLEHAHLKFLFFLLSGIALAIVGMARVMHFMLSQHPVEIWSLFFGLIAASIYIVGKRIERLNTANLLLCALGALGSYLLVGMIPVATPETLWFVFLCGSIAICAMILPGISGAFILLMLGKYEYITRTLKNPFLMENMEIILVFLAGAGLGIIVFSRLLHYLLHRWHAATVSVLTGFMVGALRKVWPWKEVLESAVIRGKVHVLREQNVLPDLGGELVSALCLMIAGMLVVLALDRLSNGKSC
ncbi:DUF368 domain-containing protein [Salidesulfovibrio onnuriiensis]|uniref:DUF368 domain-containing protein n=1 Tax=Salidesulfovibrio onnuriiensis TaxID=2583823 RepID=UPI00202B7012|nr:DUF368 domain-containing protein [Salidesulfovibrio onnuriiensis]